MVLWEAEGEVGKGGREEEHEPHSFYGCLSLLWALKDRTPSYLHHTQEFGRGDVIKCGKNHIGKPGRQIEGWGLKMFVMVWYAPHL
jgi:hypothetical protein